MTSSSLPQSSGDYGDTRRDTSNWLPHATSDAAATTPIVSSATPKIAAGTAVMPCASVGNSSMSDAMAPRHPPQPRVKKTIAKKRSRLATEGSPSAPTTQEQDASTVAGTQLLKSLGGSQQETLSQPQPESINDSEPIQIDDDEPRLEDVDFGTKRKLTSVVWKDFKKVKVRDDVKAQCLHCHKQLGGKSTNGTKHLHDHLKICTLRRIKLMGQNKTLESSQACIEKLDKVKESLYELMKEYETEEDEDNTESSTPALFNSGVLSTISARVASRRPTTMRFKSELERYLEDELVPIGTENFKILDWWKVAGTHYPTLRKVARDIFAIPVTTVASESAFSTSGRVLSEHRSRLTLDILEALMCSQDWLRNKYKGGNEDTASFWSCLQEIEDDTKGLALV